MISKTQAYAASDGSLHTKLEDAQAVSLAALFTTDLTEVCVEATPAQVFSIAQRILEKRDAILDILTTTKRSRPGRRVVNGYRSKRTAVVSKAAATTAAA
jgi:hypothetical protein